MRKMVWGLEDLPAKPAPRCWLKLDDLAAQGGMALLSEGQFGAILRFLGTHYGILMEGMRPDPDPSDGRFRALLNGISARLRRLEHDPPEVMKVGGEDEGTLHFYLAPIEEPRYSREMIISLPLLEASDQTGRELRKVHDDTRIWYRHEGNVAWVEKLHGREWELIDFYNPIRTT
jgi:hypothetical protein